MLKADDDLSAVKHRSRSTGCNTVQTQLRRLFCCLPCRYVYMVCAVRPTNIGNGLAKMDVATGEVQTWHEPGGIVGEWLLSVDTWQALE